MTADHGARALLAGGEVAVVRRLVPEDAAAVLALHQRLRLRDAYLRFLGPPPKQHRLAEMVQRMVAPAAGVVAVGAFRADQLVGVANYAVLPDTGKAEIALAVDATEQAHGVGTLLLERLVAVARHNGIHSFVAEVAGENVRMLRVLRDLGLPCAFGSFGAEREVEVSLTGDEHYVDAVIERERKAEAASLSALLTPRSVCVVGAGRGPGSVGRAVLANLLGAGFPGELSAVNPHASEVLGVASFPTVDALPGTPELAVVCVPAPAVPEVVEDCGRRGVRAVVVVSAGVTGTDLAARVHDSVRRHGMRLVGPNCVGVAHTSPGDALNATFIDGGVPAGHVGVVTQSGGIGITLVELLGGLGLGVSTLVSTGDKYDVSGNDLLLWFLGEEQTEVAVLYLESFGNPRKFGRIARALARRKPLVAVRAGSTAAGQRAAASHTAASATSAVSRDALFEQAGVIAVNDLSELAGVLAALAWQPLPAGGRVAVVGNTGGLGVLAADASITHGLTLAELSKKTMRALRRRLPATASLRNPVDTTAAVDAATFEACLDAVLADDAVDIVLAEAVPTAVADPTTAVGRSALRASKPVFAVRAGQLPVVRPVLDAGGAPVTACFGDPDVAVATIAHLARYAGWLAEPAGSRADLDGVDATRAAALVRAWLAEHPDGGWLDPDRVADLVRCFRIPMVPARFAGDEATAAAMAREIAGPVAVKAVADGVLHKSAAGGVLLDVEGDRGGRLAFGTLRRIFGDRLRGVLVQPMQPGGRELLAGISNDGVFGPLVVFGLGGTDTDVIADRTARLAPLTDADAHRLTAGLRSSAKLFTGIDTGPLEELLLRVSCIAEELPEVAELDFNPVSSTPGGCAVLDARVRLAPRSDAESFLRSLRG